MQKPMKKTSAISSIVNSFLSAKVVPEHLARLRVSVRDDLL